MRAPGAETPTPILGRMSWNCKFCIIYILDRPFPRAELEMTQISLSPKVGGGVSAPGARLNKIYAYTLPPFSRCSGRRESGG